MSESTAVEDLYSYDGWLVFNELFTTDRVGDEGERSLEEVVSSFPDYESGSPNEPSSGFSEELLPEHLMQLPELSYEMEAYAEDLIALNYVDEDWVQEWGFTEEGDEQIFYKDYHDEVDIFWDTRRDIMMFRGDKQLLERKRSDLQAGLSGDMTLRQVDFDFDFFLWVLYKEYKKEELSSSLRVRNLTRSKTIGDREDNLGKHPEVKGSNNVLRSLMLIAPLLSGKKVEQLQGTFVMGQNQITAEIQHGGKVHVKVSDNPLSGMSDLRRMGISLRFLSELVDLFEDWKNMDTDDRYPPPSFFDELGGIAEEEGYKIQFDPAETKQEYERKRAMSSDTTADSEPAEDAA